MNEAAPQNEEQEAKAQAYWGPEMWEMIEAQSAPSEAEPEPQQTVPPKEFPSKKFPEHTELTPEALHNWIVAELGDIELAERVKQRPELTKQFLEGELPPTEGFFEMLYDIGASDPEFAKQLVAFAEHKDRFIPLSYQRIEGKLSEEERSKELLERKFFATKDLAEKHPEEREKTALELSMVSFADDITNNFRERFGQKKFSINPKQVRIIDQDVLEDERNEEGAPIGKFNLFDQGIKIAGKEIKPRMELNLIVHEMFHFKGYGALQKWKDTNGGSHIAKLRFGLNVYEPYSKQDGAITNMYLNSLNEAVTEDLANRVIAGIPEDHPIFGEFVKANRAKAKAYFSDNRRELEFITRSEWVAGFREDEGGNEAPIGVYIDERRMMYDLFNKIIEKNPSEIAQLSHIDGEEYLFEMLTKAYFTGNILPFGRLFNETFGHGKFREFGHLQTVEEQQAFIEGL
jgi:hypothetical protein